MSKENINEKARNRYSKNPNPKKIRARKRYEINKEKIKEKKREFYQKHREEVLIRNSQYKKENRERYTELSKLSRERRLEKLAGRPKTEDCEICGSVEKIVYDHDHTSGKFRGWICFNCNTALGHARDRIEVLYKMIDYLNKSRDV